MTTVATERVLVIPTATFREAGYFQGFAANDQLRWEALLAQGPLAYRPRGDMEHDPSFKQLIPYVIFQHRAPDETLSLFCYCRGTGQGEQRLHRKFSIGVGGHISLQDHHEDRTEIYRRGMERELEEEVEIRTTYRDRIVGMLNDDETDVGRVHLGVVHLCEVQRPDIRPRDPAMLDARFVSLTELRTKIDQMESWSQICMRTLFANAHP